MNASELLDALNRAGATLVMDGGQMRLRGAKIGEALKAELKEQRDAVVLEWQRRQAEGRDRYCEVPDAGAVIGNRDLALTATQRESVLDYMLRQPRPVHAWIMGRAGEYHLRGVPLDECELCAALDVLEWQRRTSAKQAVEWLAGLDGAAEGVKPRL